MSWGTCYSGSNNIHFDYPAIMSDGRLFTLRDPACIRNTMIKKSAGISNNYQYRQYLIKNADNIMKSNTEKTTDQCCFSKNIIHNKKPTNNKYIYQSCSDSNQPYGYETSDLKNVYLTRRELQSQLVSPILTQEELLKLRS
tara:strand:+ start:226 stop:648 length:423 start_codon:yes stop_codon:yes gene_type:complete